MKVELFTLCEGAFNTNGRLTIVNTFEDIVSNQYPWRGQLGMALKVFVSKEEAGEHDLKLSIESAVGNQKLHEMNAHMNFPTGEKAKDIHVALATNIQGIILQAPGEYKVIVEMDGSALHLYQFKALLLNAK